MTTRHPRIGVAVFLIDACRGYILLGKRQGSHGSGTLALPGGHLEWNESWSQCAAREVAEETGVTLNREAEYLTAVNTTGIDAAAAGGVDGGLHYVTIFMKAHLSPSQVDSIRNLEPNKCAGWAWVPINYLFSLYHSQESMERLASSSQQSGASQELAVSLDKLLMAERLGERISQAASREGMGVGENEGASQSRQLIIDSSAPLQQQRRGSLEPKDDEEQVAWALADDLFRGAALFKPMMTVLRERGQQLRAELQPLAQQHQEAFASTSTSNATSPPATARDVRLPPNLFPSDATRVINEALSAPPHFKHHMTLSFPTPTPLVARNIVTVLSVDKPLRPRDTRIKYEAVVEGVATPLVRVHVETSTVRLLRLTSNAVCEDVSLVVRTMQAFPGKAAAGGAKTARGTGAPAGVVFEEGTVGTVERTMAAV